MFFSNQFLNGLYRGPDAIDVHDTDAAARLYATLGRSYGSYARGVLADRWIDQKRGPLPEGFFANQVVQDIYNDTRWE